MVHELGGGWYGFDPHDENVPPEIKERALDRRNRKPAAIVTIKIFSDEQGDVEGGFEIDPDGPFGGVERSAPERFAAFLQLSQIVRNVADRLIDIYAAAPQARP